MGCYRQAMSAAGEASSVSLTESEKIRYDRQIRVWGAEAQSRIQNSRVLIVGLRGLNVEVTKNIVLAGMNVVIQSSDTVHMRDLSSNFFLTANDVGQKVRRTMCHLLRLKSISNHSYDIMNLKINL